MPTDSEPGRLPNTRTVSAGSRASRRLARRAANTAPSRGPAFRDHHQANECSGSGRLGVPGPAIRPQDRGPDARRHRRRACRGRRGRSHAPSRARMTPPAAPRHASARRPRAAPARSPRGSATSVSDSTSRAATSTADSAMPRVVLASDGSWAWHKRCGDRRCRGAARLAARSRARRDAASRVRAPGDERTGEWLHGRDVIRRGETEPVRDSRSIRAEFHWLHHANDHGASRGCSERESQRRRIVHRTAIHSDIGSRQSARRRPPDRSATTPRRALPRGGEFRSSRSREASTAIAAAAHTVASPIGRESATRVGARTVTSLSTASRSSCCRKPCSDPTVRSASRDCSARADTRAAPRTTATSVAGKDAQHHQADQQLDQGESPRGSSAASQQRRQVRSIRRGRKEQRDGIERRRTGA